jgi:hypothetical protein
MENQELVYLISSIVGVVLTFVLGYLKDNPKYRQAKKGLSAISKAMEDDKISQAEVKEIIDILVKPGTDKEAHGKINKIK